jgi:catechol 2,3-dioxygenase-like lactoylglutathione lyase family enzyme
MQLNGIAHIQLTVNDVSVSKPFWKPLLDLFEMKPLIDTDTYYYAIGSRTGIAIAEAEAEAEDELKGPFQQRRVGLHHICLRARERAQIDEIHEFVRELPGATVIHGPQEDSFAPGYYSVLFEDPDGIRVEANFVPGKGHLADTTSGA